MSKIEKWKSQKMAKIGRFGAIFGPKKAKKGHFWALFETFEKMKKSDLLFSMKMTKKGCFLPWAKWHFCCFFKKMVKKRVKKGQKWSFFRVFLKKVEKSDLKKGQKWPKKGQKWPKKGKKWGILGISDFHFNKGLAIGF